MVDSATIGVIAGISATAFILIIVFVIALIILCRHRAKRARNRSQQYIIHNSQSPFGSMNGHHMEPSYATDKVPGSTNFGPVDTGFYPDVRTTMPGHSRFQSAGLAASMQSINRGYDNPGFHPGLYDKLTETTHQLKGRPLYVCKRPDYYRLADYFDIVGKTRTGEWVVRPRPSVPNKPKRWSQRKNKNSADKKRQENGHAAAVINTPFGQASRVPTRYLSGSHINHAHEERGVDNPVFIAPQAHRQFTSLPRLDRYDLTGKRRQPNADREHHQPQGKKVERSDSKNSNLDERLYAAVMKKHALPQSNEAAPTGRSVGVYSIEERPEEPISPGYKMADHGHRERSGSTSTQKSLGITEHFQFLEQYEAEEERF